jgi:hypothetical protein
MRRAVAPLMLLLLAVLHAPTQAQALVSFLPDFFFSTNEPATLILTGVALLSLSQVGSRSR